MSKDGYLLLLAQLVEVIHVELPHKRRKLSVLEVLRKNERLELFLILDDEAVTVIRPAYSIAVLLVLRWPSIIPRES